MQQELLERLARVPVVDTHEHMTMEAAFIAGSYDFTNLMDYVGLDLGLAGFPAGPWGDAQVAVQKGDSIDEKWQQIKPLWPHVRTGAYARHYRRTLQRFFGVDDLDDRSVHEVSARIADYQRPGVYDEWLHDRYGIRTCLQVGDHHPVAEPQHFAQVFCFDALTGGYWPVWMREALGGDLPPHFPEFRQRLLARIDAAAANGAVGLKIGWTARTRPLDFVEQPADAVQEAYAFMRQQTEVDCADAALRARLKPFQDAAFWAVFEKAGELGLPIQIHSGLEFMQPWDGRPATLIPSLVRFPDTKFAIFHGSYPHMAELTGLAKSFHNVTLDLAWFHLLSEHQARAWLAEWLDVLPHNKLFAFGGDVFLFFSICTHLEIARENVAAVLADRIARGLCDIDEAEHTARLLLHDNPWNTFAFENWLESRTKGSDLES